MAFKAEHSEKYVAYDATINSWVIISDGHLVVSQHITGNKFVLMCSGQLPSSHGSVILDSMIESISRKHFKKCDPIEQYDTDTKTLLISFAGTSQFGFVVL
jgi:hypothetical protein